MSPLRRLLSAAAAMVEAAGVMDADAVAVPVAPAVAVVGRVGAAVEVVLAAPGVAPAVPAVPAAVGEAAGWVVAAVARVAVAVVLAAVVVPVAAAVVLAAAAVVLAAAVVVPWRRRRSSWWRRRWRGSLMLSPKRVKHRKQHRGRRAGLSRGQVKVQFGEYGLKSVDAGWLTNRQIEAARIAMTRKIKRGGKVWINVYPDKPFTKKPAETRMGSGKGSPEGWVAVVKPGRVMFELAGVPEPLAREAMRLAGHKLPVKTKFVMREDG